MDPPGLRIGPLVPEQVYERLDDCDPEGSQDSALHGEEQQPLLHVPEGLRGSWHHVQNLDSFFTKISFCALPGRRGTGGRETGVHYHQRSGFACILLEDVFQLGQFIFIVIFTTFLLRCVDYSVLFANQPKNRTRPGSLHSKVTLSDAIVPSSQCAQRIRSSPLLVFLLILAAAFWLFQLLRSVCKLFSYWDIRVFYREALRMPPWLSEGQTEASLSERAEDGKTELSLMRFSLLHPQWCPPGHSSKFLGHLRGRVQQDAAAWDASSVRSPPSPGILSNSASPLQEAFPANLSMQPLGPPQDLSPIVPCPAAATASLLASISRMTQDSSCVSPGGTGGQKLAQLPEVASADMSLHAIYLHQLHRQQQQELWGEASASSLSRPWSSLLQTLSPEEEKPSWSSGEALREPTDTQKEPGQATSTD
ncbi:Autophagy-related protein 9B, partial [Eschrichtius robustus]|nr:Autophagy-related protein 9B [Eschrichtius robustus]